MPPEVAPDGGRSRPDWVEPAVRCGLEVTLLALIAAYLWLNVESDVLGGVIAVLGLVGAVAVFFYYVNQQALAWVQYASNQSRRKKRRRKRKRRKRQRQSDE